MPRALHAGIEYVRGDWGTHHSVRQVLDPLTLHIKPLAQAHQTCLLCVRSTEVFDGPSTKTMLAAASLHVTDSSKLGQKSLAFSCTSISSLHLKDNNMLQQE